MADFFVSTDRGSDTTGAGTATSPWKTINKAIGSGQAVGATLSAPTNLHVEPGLYRETVGIQATPSAGNPLVVRGDHDGSAFAAGGYTAAKTGLVEIRAWSDDATPLTDFIFSMGTKGYVTLERLKLITGGWPAINGQSSTAITLRRCVVAAAYGSNYAIRLGGADNLVESCSIAAFSSSSASYPAIQVSDGAAATIRGCLIFGAGILTNSSSTTSIFGNTILSIRSDCVNCSGSSEVKGNQLVSLSNSAALRVGGSGSMVEDHNAFFAGTPRVNVSIGANSVSSAPFAVDFLDAIVTDKVRPMFEPSAVSPLLGLALAAWMPATDILGRPYADPPSAGCLERVDPADPEPPAVEMPRCIGF